MDPMTCIEEERVAQFPLKRSLLQWSFDVLFSPVVFSFCFRVPIFSTKMEVYVKMMYSATDDRFKIKILLRFISALYYCMYIVCILF